MFKVASQLFSPSRRFISNCRFVSSRAFENINFRRFENGGEKSSRLFSAAEYEHRLARLRERMNEREIDACLFTSIHNIAYYSNFIYCSFGRPYGLIVTPDKSVTVSALIDGGQPWRRSFGDSIIYTDWRKGNYFRAIKHVLENESKIQRMRIGVEFDHINAQTMATLKDVLQSEFVDVGERNLAVTAVAEQYAQASARALSFDL